jgi:hypothetical protein
MSVPFDKEAGGASTGDSDVENESGGFDSAAIDQPKRIKSVLGQR